MSLWPKGYNFAMLVTFDLDVDSAEYRRGDDPVARSRGRFAARRGLAKILRVLGAYNVRATFFVPGWVAEEYPHLVKAILVEGHEVAGHGYLHERLDQLDLESEIRVFEKMEGALARHGVRVRGFRAPYWRWSSNTLSILASRHYLYDSSLMDDEIPYIIKCCGQSIVEFPVDWRLDDWPYLEHYRSLTPSQLLSMWLEDVEYAAATNGFLVVTMHPQCIGRGSRIRVLEELVRAALRLGAWMPTASELAEYVMARSDRFPRVRN